METGFRRRLSPATHGTRLIFFFSLLLLLLPPLPFLPDAVVVYTYVYTIYFGDWKQLSRLCTHVGSGIQIFGMLGVTIIFAALGFMSPAARGSLLTSMVVVYLLLAVAAGYTAVRLYTTLKSSSEGWKMLCWGVTLLCPSPHPLCFLIYI